MEAIRLLPAQNVLKDMVLPGAMENVFGQKISALVLSIVGDIQLLNVLIVHKEMVPPGVKETVLGLMDNAFRATLLVVVDTLLLLVQNVLEFMVEVGAMELVFGLMEHVFGQLSPVVMLMTTVDLRKVVWQVMNVEPAQIMMIVKNNTFV